jgi:pilus assembly protein Flp/PilA
MPAKRYGFFARLGRATSGATAIEYVLIAAFIAVIIIAGVTIVGEDLSGVFNNVANTL